MVTVTQCMDRKFQESYGPRDWLSLTYIAASMAAKSLNLSRRGIIPQTRYTAYLSLTRLTYSFVAKCYKIPLQHEG